MPFDAYHSFEYYEMVIKVSLLMRHFVSVSSINVVRGASVYMKSILHSA